MGWGRRGGGWRGGMSLLFERCGGVVGRELVGQMDWIKGAC